MWQLFPRRAGCAQWGCGFVRQEGAFGMGESSVLPSAELNHNEDVKGILGDIMEIRLLDQTWGCHGEDMLSDEHCYLQAGRRDEALVFSSLAFPHWCASVSVKRGSLFCLYEAGYTSVTGPITTTYKSTAWAALYISSYGSPHLLYALREVLVYKSESLFLLMLAQVQIPNTFIVKTILQLNVKLQKYGLRCSWELFKALQSNKLWKIHWK